VGIIAVRTQLDYCLDMK